MALRVNKCVVYHKVNCHILLDRCKIFTFALLSSYIYILSMVFCISAFLLLIPYFKV